MKTLADFDVAASMRDVIKKIATKIVNDLRPHEEYATVVAFDRTNRKCTVRYAGDANDVVLPMGTIQPAVVNQKVRIAGNKGDRYVAEVVSKTGAYLSTASTYTTAGTGTTSTGTTVTPVIPYVSSGILTVRTGVTRFRFPFGATILGISGMVSTAPTGAAIIFDVNRNGNSVFTSSLNRPQIAVGSFSTLTEIVPDVFSMTLGDYLTVDIDQIGSTVAGSDLTVFIRYRQT